MLLLVYEPPDHRERLVATNPDAALIDATVKALHWRDVTFVVLKRDEDNWMEGSGSLKPEDGLSARYMLNGDEHVSARAPRSLHEIIVLLQSYVADDERWRHLMEWA